jgi:hypothetical protein
VIAFFTRGVGSTTLPVFLFSAIKRNVSPEINAIAMKLGIEKTAMIRVRAGISYALTEAKDGGTAACRSKSWARWRSSCLMCQRNSSRRPWTSNWRKGTVISDTVADTRCVFLAGLHRSEQAIAERLQTLASGKLPWAWIDPDKALPWIQQKTDLSLTPHAEMRRNPHHACWRLHGHLPRRTRSPCPKPASRALITAAPSSNSMLATMGSKSGTASHEPSSKPLQAANWQYHEF